MLASDMTTQGEAPDGAPQGAKPAGGPVDGSAGRPTSRSSRRRRGPRRLRRRPPSQRSRRHAAALRPHNRLRPHHRLRPHRPHDRQNEPGRTEPPPSPPNGAPTEPRRTAAGPPGRAEARAAARAATVLDITYPADLPGLAEERRHRGRHPRPPGRDRRGRDRLRQDHPAPEDLPRTRPRPRRPDRPHAAPPDRRAHRRRPDRRGTRTGAGRRPSASRCASPTTSATRPWSRS